MEAPCQTLGRASVSSAREHYLLYRTQLIRGGAENKQTITPPHIGGDNTSYASDDAAVRMRGGTGAPGGGGSAGGTCGRARDRDPPIPRFPAIATVAGPRLNLARSYSERERRTRASRAVLRQGFSNGEELADGRAPSPQLADRGGGRGEWGGHPHAAIRTVPPLNSLARASTPTEASVRPRPPPNLPKHLETSRNPPGGSLDIGRNQEFDQEGLSLEEAD